MYIRSFWFSILFLFDFSFRRCLAEIWSSVEICQKFWKVKQRKSWIQLCAPKSHPLLTWTLDKQKTKKKVKYDSVLPSHTHCWLGHWTNKQPNKQNGKTNKSRTKEKWNLAWCSRVQPTAYSDTKKLKREKFHLALKFHPPLPLTNKQKKKIKTEKKQNNKTEEKLNPSQVPSDADSDLSSSRQLINRLGSGTFLKSCSWKFCTNFLPPT